MIYTVSPQKIPTFAYMSMQKLEIFCGTLCIGFHSFTKYDLDLDLDFPYSNLNLWIRISGEHQVESNLNLSLTFVDVKFVEIFDDRQLFMYFLIFLCDTIDTLIMYLPMRKLYFPIDGEIKRILKHWLWNLMKKYFQDIWRSFFINCWRKLTISHY